MKRLLCVLVLTAPLTSCTWVLGEYDTWPTGWDANPPDTITLDMDEHHVDELGRDWQARCLDTGGVPVVLAEQAWCVNVDY